MAVRDFAVWTPDGRHETGIQWTQVPGYVGATWNPTTGCSRVSPGCNNCYAFTLHDQRYVANRDHARAYFERFDNTHPTPAEYRALSDYSERPSLPFGPQYDVPFSTVQVLGEDRLTEPLRKQKPHAFFVDSMADLFHEDVPDEAIDRVFAVMALSPQHLFMILTKRPERMREYLTAGRREYQADLEGRRLPVAGGAFWPEGHAATRIIRELARMDGEGRWKSPTPRLPVWPLPNVWLGVSTEDQERADERIPLLLDTPAAVRFVSAEPLLGPIEFSDVTGRSDAVRQLGRPALAGIDWVIVGGESGPHARPFRIGWARSIVEQCRAAGTATFVKQIGSRPMRDGPAVVGEPVLEIWTKHRHGGNPDEWPEDLRVREFPLEASA